MSGKTGALLTTFAQNYDAAVWATSQVGQAGPELVEFVLEDLNITQRELAREVCTSQGYISNLTSGAKTMSLKFASRLHHARSAIIARRGVKVDG